MFDRSVQARAERCRVLGANDELPLEVQKHQQAPEFKPETPQLTPTGVADEKRNAETELANVLEEIQRNLMKDIVRTETGLADAQRRKEALDEALADIRMRLSGSGKRQ